MIPIFKFQYTCTDNFHLVNYVIEVQLLFSTINMSLVSFKYLMHAVVLFKF